MADDAFVVPLKSFHTAKTRLRARGVEDVTALARELAAGVLRACRPGHVIVLSESDDVTTFAMGEGAEVLESAAGSLNEAVQNAYDALATRFSRLIIVHGDLRSPQGLGAFVPDPGITIVTDHRARGTNVLAVPTGRGFRFAYGEDSASRHVEEAKRVREPWRLITDSRWQYDIDEPADLKEPPTS